MRKTTISLGFLILFLSGSLEPAQAIICPPGKTVLRMAIDPKDPNTLYVGTRGAGVFKSTGGGDN